MKKQNSKKLFKQPGDYLSIPAMMLLLTGLVINTIDEFVVHTCLGMFHFFRGTEAPEAEAAIPWMWLLYLLIPIFVGMALSGYDAPAENKEDPGGRASFSFG